MNQDIVAQDKNGSELVVEFLNMEDLKLSPDLREQMLTLIYDSYGCSPNDLKITDDEANTLIEKLYLIARPKELEIANMTFGSR